MQSVDASTNPLEDADQQNFHDPQIDVDNIP